MDAPLKLHEPGRGAPRIQSFEPPRPLAAALGAGFGLLSACFLGQLTTWTLTQGYPAWLESARSLPLHRPWFRLLAGGAAGASGICALLVMIGYGRKTWSILSHRLGLVPLRESEGPANLIEEEGGRWGLALQVISGDDPGSPWPLTTTRFPEGRRGALFFRIDEASAAEMSRRFHPGEPVRARWCDFPLPAGPTLLQIQAPAEAAMDSDRLPEQGEKDLRQAA